MRKIIFIFLITFNFSNAQVTNNCTTTNFLTKTDANGNLVCSKFFEIPQTIIIGDVNLNADPSTDFEGYRGIGRVDIGNELNVRGNLNSLGDISLNTYPNTSSYYDHDRRFRLFNDYKSNGSSVWSIGNTRTGGWENNGNGFSIVAGWSQNQTRFFIEDETGNVGIGTVTPPAGYKLAVAGKIIAEELKVQLQTSWPDYVFTNDYKLPTLEEVEKQIKEKGHLKNVPSAQEVKENGIELGEITRIQQEKIEELTLYIIELNKKLEALEAKVNDK